MNSGNIAAAIILPVCLALAAPAALAQNDPRLVTKEYSASEVVKIQGKLGVQATIGFEPGELIENVAVGDSQKWQITPNKRADLLFVKPLELAAVTNMTVVTNRRTYLFDLVASAKERPIYMFQFTYGGGTPTVEPSPVRMAAVAPVVAAGPVAPPPVAATPAAPVAAVPARMRTPAQARDAAVPARSAVDEVVGLGPDSQSAMATPGRVTSPTAASIPTRDPADPAVLSFAWGRQGGATLFPLRVYDDGVATYLMWAGQQALPEILIPDANGIMELANYTLVSDMIVIGSVPGRIFLRSGAISATLTNMRKEGQPVPASAAVSLKRPPDQEVAAMPMTTGS